VLTLRAAGLANLDTGQGFTAGHGLRAPRPVHL
jgi:hypothetical protein